MGGVDTRDGSFRASQAPWSLGHTDVRRASCGARTVDAAARPPGDEQGTLEKNSFAGGRDAALVTGDEFWGYVAERECGASVGPV